MIVRWANGNGDSGTYERCGIGGCLRSEGHQGAHRHPYDPVLGPGRCRGCGAEVWYKRSAAGWRLRWRDTDGRVHRCGRTVQ
jgi:hypothetical protein